MNKEIGEELKEMEMEISDAREGAEEAPVATLPKKRGRPRCLNNSVTVKMVMDAITKTGGRMEEACKIVGISITEFYKRFRYNPKVEDTLKEARKMGFELVTDTLLDKAMKGDMAATKLYLKYNPIAKENRWVDSQVLLLKEDKPLTEEEKQTLAKHLFGE